MCLSLLERLKDFSKESKNGSGEQLTDEALTNVCMLLSFFNNLGFNHFWPSFNGSLGFCCSAFCLSVFTTLSCKWCWSLRAPLPLLRNHCYVWLPVSKSTEWFNGQLVKTKLSQLKYDQCSYQNIIMGFLLLRKSTVHIQYTGFKSGSRGGNNTMKADMWAGGWFLIDFLFLLRRGFSITPSKKVPAPLTQQNCNAYEMLQHK